MKTAGIAWALPSHGKTPHDALPLPLPSGRKVGDVKIIGPVLIALGIPGVTHDTGRAEAIERYAEFIDKLRNDAADAAVQAWLTQKAAQ